MSDKIRGMANTTSLDEIGDLLADVCEILKQHQETLVELEADVDGLKSAMTGGPESNRFAARQQSAKLASAPASDALIARLDAAIQRLRET